METLGTLIDKISIVNLKLWHVEDMLRDTTLPDAEYKKYNFRKNNLNMLRCKLVEEIDNLFKDITEGNKEAEVINANKLFIPPRNLKDIEMG